MRNVTIIIPAVRREMSQKAAESAMACPGATVMVWMDKHRTGCPKMVKNMVEATNTDLIMFLGDDTEIQPGALEAALDKMNDLPDGWGVVGLNTENGKRFAHWLADKRMLELLPDGMFFNTAYHHYYCDEELKDIAMENGRWAWAEEAHVKHHHPSDGVTEPDDIHISLQPKLKADWQTYCRRKRERMGNKIAIGFPLVDDQVPVRFFTSFACMEKPSEYTLLVPQFPHGPWTGSIADARNSLVEQALRDGCRHLLMLDTDQVYPSDTLTRLLSHKKDVCGVRVHRRWAPFDPIFLRGDIGKYESVSDEEMYSGDLIQVDATGTGCLLFDMEVFLKVDPPWFEFGHHNGKSVGEDIGFCSKARKAGIEIFVDTGIAVGHLATVQIDRFFHEVCKKMTFKM